LRVLRAAQFAARFDFNIDESTIEIMKTMNIKNLSKERIFVELEKALLKSKKPSQFFNTLNTIGHLDYWFKELKDLQGVLQSPKNHPEGDAYIHTLMVIDEASKIKDKSSNPLYFMLSALCHDLGKKRATVVTPEKITSYEHHLLGRDETRDFLTRITNKGSLLAYVDNMVYLHMKPRMMYKDGSKINAYRRLTRDSYNVYDLMLLTKADTLGRTNPDIFKVDEMFHNVVEKLRSVRDDMLPVVQGRDLIAIGFEPGPELGIMLKECYELQLDGFNKHVILNIMKQRGK
ncbi:MAG: HD domain-containing protein, partial [Paraclostridium sp.]